MKLVTTIYLYGYNVTRIKNFLKDVSLLNQEKHGFYE